MLIGAKGAALGELAVGEAEWERTTSGTAGAKVEISSGRSRMERLD